MTFEEKVCHDVAILKELKSSVQEDDTYKLKSDEFLRFINTYLNPIPPLTPKGWFNTFLWVTRDQFWFLFKIFAHLSIPLGRMNLESRKRKIGKRIDNIPDDLLIPSKREVFRYLVAIVFALTIFSVGFYILPDFELKNTNTFDLGLIFGLVFILLGVIATFEKSTKIVFAIRRRNRSIEKENSRLQRTHIAIIILPLIILFMVGTVFSSLKSRNYSLYKEGKAAIKELKWNQADEIFTKLIHSNFIQFADVGDIFYEKGQYKLADKYYKLNQFISSYYRFVLSAFYSGDLDKAYEEAWFSIKARGDYSGHKKAVLIYILGRVCQHRNDMPSAIQHYYKSLEQLSDGELKEEVKQRLIQVEIASGLAENNYQIARQNFSTQKYKEAYPYFEKAYLSTSDSILRFKARHSMGHCKRFMGDYVEAKNIFLEILSKLDLQKLDKELLARVYYATIGLGFWEEDNCKKGIEYARKAYESFPTNLRIRNQLAWYLITSRDKSLRRPHEALEIASETDKMDKGQTPMYLDTFAGCYASICDFERAVFYSQKAVDLAKTYKVDVKIIEKNLKSYKESQIPWDSIISNVDCKK